MDDLSRNEPLDTFHMLLFNNLYFITPERGVFYSNDWIKKKTGEEKEKN